MVFERERRAEGRQNAFGREAEHLAAMGPHGLHDAPRRRFQQQLQILQVRRRAGPWRQAGGEGGHLLPLAIRRFGRDRQLRRLPRQRFTPECRHLRARLDLQLAAQQVGAGGVLARDFDQAPLVEVKADQVAMGLLRQRLEHHRPLQGGASRRRIAARPRHAPEPHQCVERDVVQPAPFRGEPLVKTLLTQRHAVEQRPTVELGRFGQRLESLRCRPRLEVYRIHGDAAGHECKALARREQPVHIAERGADRGQGLAEAVPGLRLAPVAPEQRGQPLTRAWRASGQGDDREKRFRFTRGQRRPASVGTADLEATEKADAGFGHRCVRPPSKNWA